MRLLTAVSYLMSNGGFAFPLHFAGQPFAELHQCALYWEIPYSRNEALSFVGPNGAGKSTVMKMILNLIQPEAGEVQLFGEKVTEQSYEVFKRVGSIIENPYFYRHRSARQSHK